MVRLLFIICFGFATWCGMATGDYYASCRVEQYIFKHSDLVLDKSTWCLHCYCLEGKISCLDVVCKVAYPGKHSCTDIFKNYLAHGDKPVDELPCYCIDGVVYCSINEKLVPSRFG